MAKSGGVGGKRRGRAKWVALVLFGGLVFLAVKVGWAGFAWAHIKSATVPRDDALLAWIPADTTAVAVVDPHQVSPKTLGAAQGVVRTSLERLRSDIQKATGVDLAFDVDKVAVTPSLLVMRGRFDGERITQKLAEYGYVRADYQGRHTVVRAGEDALFVSDDEVIVYGDEASIKSSADARAGISLANDDQIVARLAQIGWNHALIGTVRLGADRPSLRAMIAGTSGPHAVTFGLRAAKGIQIDARVEVGSATSAEEFGKLLEDKRMTAGEALRSWGPDLAAQIAEVARTATVRVDAPSATVRLNATVSPDSVDALYKAASASPWVAETYKTYRLAQLLAPSP
ncbi:MAG: hypothetical protein ABTD50_18070 [Polyangiaceae bacterium]|jgi:hypothetical protein